MQKRKVLIGAGTVAAGAALALGGAFAAFTDTEGTSADVDAGQLDIVAAQTIAVTDMAPGDVAHRLTLVELPDATNDGDLVQAITLSIPAASITDTPGLAVDNGDPDPGTGDSSSLLDPDGLIVQIRNCVGGTWTLPDVGDPAADDATCSGTIESVEAPAPLATIATGGILTFEATDLGVTPTATGTIPDNSVLNLLVSFELPAAADNSFESAATQFDLNWTAIQRDGINK